MPNSPLKRTEALYICLHLVSYRDFDVDTGVRNLSEVISNPYLLKTAKVNVLLTKCIEVGNSYSGLCIYDDMKGGFRSDDILWILQRHICFFLHALTSIFVREAGDETVASSVGRLRPWFLCGLLDHSVAQPKGGLFIPGWTSSLCTAKLDSVGSCSVPDELMTSLSILISLLVNLARWMEFDRVDWLYSVGELYLPRHSAAGDLLTVFKENAWPAKTH